ncbi:MAG: class I SAM-dependent methyltransferase [Verrucomicrobia subdivision 3 bacterium]|nr:class I SAM-dependent methyltransferase [Limisphaerales bacterium]
MNASFNVNEYWRQRGRGYIHENLPQEYHRLQEQFLIDVLRRVDAPFRQILELGCGFGRITRLLADAFPQATILATDLSAEQLANARHYCAGRSNTQFHAYDFYSGAPFPGGRHDAAVAIEVFLHHPEDVVRRIVERLKGVSRHIVNIDWSEHWPWARPEHVWVHDYCTIYREAGLQAVALPLPRKIDGLQQRLFVAGSELPARLLELSGSEPRSEQGPAPPVLEWHQTLEGAIADLNATLPPEAKLILVGAHEWGSAGDRVCARRVMPFLERAGEYWGPPADDASGLKELDRMQSEGATHIAFAWSCFWWLEHYAGFASHLRQNYPRVLTNDRVIVFELRR